MSFGHYDPRWCRPSYEEEAHEFERTSLELQIPVEQLHEAFKIGQLVDLNNWIWCSLGNTDSNDVFSLAEAEERAKLYSCDLDRIIRGMSSRAAIPAPIILRLGEVRPYLVSGNTRLMACRVLNVHPKVWMISERKP